MPKAELTGLDLLEDRLALAADMNFDVAAKDLSIYNEGKEFDLVFLCAGAAKTVEIGLNAAANGATLVVFSSTAQQAVFDNNDIYYKELTVLGSYSPNLKNLDESLELISKGKIKVDKLITHRASLEKLGAGIKQAQEEKGIKTFMQL